MGQNASGGGGGGGTAGTTFIAAAEITGSVSPNLDVTAIPSTYKHLQVYARLRLNEVATGNDNAQMVLGAGTFDTGNNYRYAELEIDQTPGVTPFQVIGQSYLSLGRVPIPWGGFDPNVWGRVDLTILDYANVTYWRTVAIQSWTHNGNANYNRGSSIAHWQDTTNPVQRIRIQAESGHNFLIGSKIWVYGLA